MGDLPDRFGAGTALPSPRQRDRRLSCAVSAAEHTRNTTSKRQRLHIAEAQTGHLFGFPGVVLSRKLRCCITFVGLPVLVSSVPARRHHVGSLRAQRPQKSKNLTSRLSPVGIQSRLAERARRQAGRPPGVQQAAWQALDVGVCSAEGVWTRNFTSGTSAEFDERTNSSTLRWADAEVQRGTEPTGRTRASASCSQCRETS
jgi:hypothetical protein